MLIFIEFVVVGRIGVVICDFFFEFVFIMMVVGEWFFFFDGFVCCLIVGVILMSCFLFFYGLMVVFWGKLCCLIVGMLCYGLIEKFWCGGGFVLFCLCLLFYFGCFFFCWEWIF